MFVRPSERFGRRAVVALVFVMCLGGSGASAQRVVATLYGTGGGGGSPNAVVVYNFATGQMELSQPGTGTGGSVFTADGRYVLLTRRLSSSPQTLELYDTSTRSVTPLPLSFNPTFTHPRALSLFGYDGGSVARLEPAGVAPLPACGIDLTLGFDVTLDGSAVVALCANPFVPGSNARAVILDAGTGAQVRSIDLGTTAVRAVATNGDASRILVLTAMSTNAFGLLLVDTVMNQSSTVFVDSPFPTGSVAGGCTFAGVTRARDRAAVQCQWTNFTTSTMRTELVTFDAGVRRTLTAVPGQGTMHFSPDDAIAIVGSATVSILDVVADRLLASYPVSAAIHDVAFPPGAPVGLAAVRTGSAVRLDWALPASSPAATGYVLEAGAAPGQSNLLTLNLAAVTSLSVGAVPPGRYYVRVRATNVTGTGPASSEIVVDVP